MNNEPQQNTSHWIHRFAEVTSKIFLVLGLLSLLLAWSTISGGTVFGLALAHWYWNALVFGILAIGVRKSFGCDSTCQEY